MSGRGLQIGAVLERLHAGARKVRGELAGAAALDAETAQRCVDALLSEVEADLPDTAMMPIALLAAEYPTEAPMRVSAAGTAPGQRIVDAFLVDFVNLVVERQGLTQRLTVEDLDVGQ